MSPIVLFLDWLEQYVSLAGYTPSRGMWVEADGDKNRYVCIWVNAGRPPLMDLIQYPQIRLVIAGKRNGQSSGDTVPVENFAHGIIQAALANSETSCIAMVKPLGSIMGPYYSEQGRPWYEVNFELTI